MSYIPADVLDQWLSENNIVTAKRVNSGDCENFAMDMLSHIPKGEIVGTDNFDGWDTKFPGHIWIYDGEKHYDSECLDGTACWKDLPIMKRYLGV